MKRKEYILGAALAAVVFLIYIGTNTVPFLLFAALGGALYFRGMTPPGTKRKTAVVSSKKYQISFDDIGGQNTAKQELREALNFIKSDQDAIRMGIRPLKGILLCGPPGTGKTLLAKAAASYTDAAFLSVAGSDFIEMYAGVGAQRVRELFARAQQLSKEEGKTRSIIFIDEIDVLGAKRGQTTSHMEYDQTLNQLLVEMDGLKAAAESSVLLIGATNRSDMLDPALTRPGRFDRIVRVDLPDKEARLQILRLHTSKKPMDGAVNLEKLAAETAGFSGAHLESLTNEAAILAWRSSHAVISHKHFEDSIDKVMMGETHDRRPGKQELKRIALHELGHAFAAEHVRPGSVSNISILSRGGALGYVRHNPEQDLYLETEELLRGQLVVMLAGGVAEELFEGSRSTGTQGDYQQAIQVALKMIGAGMSELGIVDERLVPKSALHAIVQGILGEAETKAKTVLTECQESIHTVLAVLLEQEKMSGDEIRTLMVG